MKTIERWDIFELELKGKPEGNPFMDYEISATFKGDREEKTVEGFYDGDGTYRIRFMPSFEGVYHYEAKGTFQNELAQKDKLCGSFTVSPASSENHGPVRVLDEVHLRYEDGSSYYSIGTTCYAWANQTQNLQEQTLETLKDSPFNKIRFCFFPKYYLYNTKEPLTYPFERGHGEGLDMALVKKAKEECLTFPGMKQAEFDLAFDYTRPNTAHFRRYDERIRQLRDMGVEADIILMHPYDRWGNIMMDAKSCDSYLRYVNARYGAYRNVWWSLANEYDLIRTKSTADWERYGTFFQEKDPYQHLRSIHNCGDFYDHSRPWITHCSLQRIDFYKTTEETGLFMEKYKKPIVWDEICYEGNLELGWGNITGQELVRRFWEGALRGGHCGHGETFLAKDDILWWSHGGRLKGESVPRLQFLLDILKEVPGGYLKEGHGIFDETVGIAATEKTEGRKNRQSPFAPHTSGYEIHYLGIMQPAYRDLYLPEERKFQVDLIDTWEMTVTDMGVHSGIAKIKMPQHPYMAVRIVEVSS